MADVQRLRHELDVILELHESGELEQALERCETLAERTADVGEGADPVQRETAFAARFERALLLTELGELDVAAQAYAQAAGVPVDESDPDQRHETAMALLNRGICLDAVEQHEQALDAYEQLITRFAHAEDPVTRDQVVRARVNRAAGLLALDRPAAAIDAVEQFEAELSRHDALDAEQLVLALRIAAAATAVLEEPEVAAAVIDGLEPLTDDDPAVRVQVAAARVEQADLLAEDAAAADRLALVLTRYEEDPDPAVQEALAAVRERLSDLRASDAR